MSDFWVFGYGSLIWNPGFEFHERQKATVFGLHRALCVYSWVHRGTQDNPGLVLGLDRGGSCTGMAMRAPHAKRTEIIDYLRAREQVTSVYVECWQPVRLENGETVDALLYKVDQTSPQYAKGLGAEDQIAIVNRAVGGSGHNTEYVAKTIAAMAEAGIRDHKLEQIRDEILYSSA